MTIGLMYHAALNELNAEIFQHRLAFAGGVPTHTIKNLLVEWADPKGVP